MKLLVLTLTTVALINDTAVSTYQTNQKVMYRNTTPDAAATYEVCFDPEVGFIKLSEIKDADDAAVTIESLQAIFTRMIEVGANTCPMAAGVPLITPTPTPIPNIGIIVGVATAWNAAQVTVNFSDAVASKVAETYLILNGTEIKKLGTPTKNQIVATIDGLAEQTEYTGILCVVTSDNNVIADQPVFKFTTPEDTQKPEAVTLASLTGWPGTAGTVEGNVITFDGKIPYYVENKTYQREAGNYIGVQITTPAANLTNFPNLEIYLDNQKKYGADIFNEYPDRPNTFALWWRVRSIGDARTITIKWDALHSQDFIIKVGENATFDTESEAQPDDNVKSE